MKTIENTNGSQVGALQSFQDSLAWNNNHIHNENIQETFLEALKCGVQRHIAFAEVANTIRKTGTTVKNNTLHKLWHSARCKWQTLQHSQRNIQPIRNRPKLSGRSECKSVNKQENINRTTKADAVDIVIDGLNVIYGTPSSQKPALVNLLGLVRELKNRNLTFKCFFDASTPYKLGRPDEADAYRQLCHDFPDTFIEVPSRNQADSFLLHYSNHARSLIVTNDCFRDYYEKYPWLERNCNWRASFIVHSNTMQIPALNLMATIPEDLASADLSHWAGVENSVPAHAPNNYSGTTYHASSNENSALAA
jgi:hypothetical protein